MKQWLLFISKQERTLDEIRVYLKRYYADTEVPEYYFGDVDEYVNKFKETREQHFANRLGYLDELKKNLKDAKGRIEILYYKREIEQEEAYSKVMEDNDMIAWLALDKMYVRDGKIYTTNNGKTGKGFIDEICETTSQFLTDIEGNQVECCACRNLNLDTLDDIYALAYIVYEDSDEYSMYVTGQVDLFKEIHQHLIDSIPLDSYARIVEFHAHD